jgi:hypothetical protein
MQWPTLSKLNLQRWSESYLLQDPPAGWHPALTEAVVVVRDPGVDGDVGWRWEWSVLSPNDRRPLAYAGQPVRLADHEFRALRAMCRAARSPGVLTRFPARSVAHLPDVVLVERDVPGAGLRAGDLILPPEEDALTLYCDLPAVPGRAWTLPREAHSPLRDAHRSRGVLRSLTPWWHGYLMRKVEDARQWGRGGPRWTPRLRVWRALNSGVSEPVRASSDDAAIFELLSSVGCRMPEAKR